MTTNPPPLVRPEPAYAGIGSRSTPAPVAAFMEQMAWRLTRCGYKLRCGASVGAEAAFSRGCTKAGGSHEIWLPHKGFNGYDESGLVAGDRHHAMAAKVHPLWKYLSPELKQMVASRVALVLGDQMRRPVEFVICWTQDGFDGSAGAGVATGHSHFSIMLAASHSIPVFNLSHTTSYQRLLAYLRRRHLDQHIHRVATSSNI